MQHPHLELSSVLEAFFSLKQDYDVLKEQYSSIQKNYDSIKQIHDFLQKENKCLRELIKSANQKQYGASSEKRIAPGQQTLQFFNEVEMEAPQADDEDEQTHIKGHTRRKKKKKIILEELPVEIRVIDLPESEKFAPDGTPLKLVGKEISKKLEYTPAQLKVIEIHRLKYEIVKDNGEEGVQTAALPPAIIPKSIATPSLLAGIAINKYALGLPLYRQEHMFAWNGVTIPRGTMARWLILTAEAAQGVWNILEDKLLASPYVSCDETHVQVLKEKGKKPQSQSYMWVRSTPAEQEKIVLFDYDPSRSGAVPKKLFQDYKGYLQTDAYAGYNALVGENKDITRLGCAMHSRRKFIEAQKVDPQSKVASQAIKYFQELYKIEADIKTESMESRYALRLERALPVWNQFMEWAAREVGSTLPKSKIGQALRYLLEEKEELMGYLKAGFLEIDNGFAERAIRQFAIGRNNWLFADTPAGAQASSILYSFIITARMNKVNLQMALQKLLEELPLAQSIEDYERLAGYLLRPFPLGP